MKLVNSKQRAQPMDYTLHLILWAFGYNCTDRSALIGMLSTETHILHALLFAYQTVHIYAIIIHTLFQWNRRSQPTEWGKQQQQQQKQTHKHGKILACFLITPRMSIMFNLCSATPTHRVSTSTAIAIWWRPIWFARSSNSRTLFHAQCRCRILFFIAHNQTITQSTSLALEFLVNAEQAIDRADVGMSKRILLLCDWV